MLDLETIFYFFLTVLKAGIVLGRFADSVDTMYEIFYLLIKFINELAG